MDASRKRVKSKVKIIASQFIFLPPPFNWKSSRKDYKWAEHRKAHTSVFYVTATPCPQAISQEVEIRGTLTVSNRHLPEQRTRFKQIQGRSEQTKGVKTKGTCDASAPLPINLLPLVLKEVTDSKCIFQYISQTENCSELGHKFPRRQRAGWGGRGKTAVTQEQQKRGCPTFTGYFPANFIISLARDAPAKHSESSSTPPQQVGKVFKPQEPSPAATGRNIRIPCRKRYGTIILRSCLVKSLQAVV